MRMPTPELVMDIFKCSREIATQAIQGYQNYRRWADTSKLEIVEQELHLVSEEHQFGGALDAILAHGDLGLGDWKTSNKLYPDHIIQLAAYDILWEENFPNRPLTGGFHLCRFSKEYGDFAHHFWAELDDARKQFLLFREAYEIDKRLKKRV